MDVVIKLEGFAELAELLKSLPEQIARDNLRAAVKAGAKIVRDEAKARIGVKPRSITGTLQRSLYFKFIKEQSSPFRPVYFVGARQAFNANTKAGDKHVKAYGKNDAYYARWVEFGHFTRSGSGQLKRGRGRTAALQAMLAAEKIKYVQPRPFLRPAFDENKQRAIDAMAKTIRGPLVQLRSRRKR